MENGRSIGDGNALSKVFGVFDVATNEFRHYTLRKFDATKHDTRRPIEVLFSSPDAVRKLLRKSSSLPQIQKKVLSEHIQLDNRPSTEEC